jgi:hypothetical protein
MNSIQKLLACLLFGLVFFTYSCNDDDDDPVGCNYATETQDELQAVLNAANEYSLDPTNTAKCQAYKDAYQNYLNELEDHVECATVSGQQQELQNAINEAQAELDNFQC